MRTNKIILILITLFFLVGCKSEIKETNVLVFNLNKI